MGPRSGASQTDSLQVGRMQLKHRVAMSAMTRLRNEPGTEAPREINAEYYAQRATPGGLLVSEATHITASGRGYVRAPGLFTEAQISGWKIITESVHKKGAYIYCQLFHPGRISHSSLLPDQQLPVAPSAIKPTGEVHVEGGRKVEYETPRALEVFEIKTIVQDFAKAAKTAVEICNFDGIEIHGGNGYLIQEFMAHKTNGRTDEYGGSVANRCKFLLEIIDACTAEVGVDRVSVKIQQGITFSDIIEPEADVLAQLDYLGPELEKRKLAYTNLSSLNGEPYFRFVGLQEPNIKEDVWRYFRKVYTDGILMMNGGIPVEIAEQYLKDGVVDLASYGVLFVANANLPALIAAGHKTEQLNQAGYDVKCWYGRDPADDIKGYTDWPLVTA